MENFAQELAVKKVLSKEDIALLKNYIAEKYTDYSSTQKSIVLANTVHKILDKNIPEVKEEYKQKIKKDLLKNMILKNGQAILLLDIFNICFSAYDKSSDSFDSLIDWINVHVESKVSITELKNYDIEKYIINDNEPVDSLDEKDNDTKLKDVNHYELSEAISKKVSSKKIINFSKIKYIACFLVVFILTFLSQNKLNHIFSFTKYQVQQKTAIMSSLTNRPNNRTFGINYEELFTSELPYNFKYKDINQIKLKNFLVRKKSLLAEEPYFSTIISVSKEYNLNPLVLFAITGQEQGFVSKNISASKVIANNPFNVYHSWKEYNTNINDACRIACVTIIDLCKGRPYFEEPFDWINRKYAEDRNWSKAVNTIYNSLEKNNFEKVNK